MTTHTADRSFTTSASRGTEALAHPSLSTAATIIGCILVAVAIGLLLIALTSNGQATTVQHQIGHAATVLTTGNASAGTAHTAAKVAAAQAISVRPWRETLRGRALGAGRTPAAALARVAQQ
jgi:hypothetical protein